MENSPFARLPAELRNRIWELALQRNDDSISDPITINPTHRLNLVRDFSDPASGHACVECHDRVEEADASKNLSVKTTLALTQTCSAVRKESNGMFYNINSFQLTCPTRLGQVDEASRVVAYSIRKNPGLSNMGSCEFQPETKNFMQKIGVGYYDELAKYIEMVHQLSLLYPNCRFTVALQFRTLHGGFLKDYPYTIELSNLEQSWQDATSRATKDSKREWDYSVSPDQSAQQHDLHVRLHIAKMFEMTWSLTEGLIRRSQQRTIERASMEA